MASYWETLSCTTQPWESPITNETSLGQIMLDIQQKLSIRIDINTAEILVEAGIKPSYPVEDPS